MRDLIVVSVLCIAAAIAVDHFWFQNKYFDAMSKGVGQSIHRLR